MKKYALPALLLVIIIIVAEIFINIKHRASKPQSPAPVNRTTTADTMWHGRPATDIDTSTAQGKLIKYGHDLIANTAYYLGPKGIVAQTSNGMNCQNCHLAAGTQPFGNNYGKVYTTYPQFRARSNNIQTIYGRINDCFERSLNGKPLDTTGREMTAIYAYIQWLAGDMPKGTTRGGTSLMKLPYINRAADTAAGRLVYAANCASCHGPNGQGVINAQSSVYTYPPLWGSHSYNDGAGLFRLGAFASFVKNNMPFGTHYDAPKLTNEQAWDVAAFVNSQARPHKDQSNDWRDITKKPVDFPAGPYADTFPAQQHKYGPWQPIAAAKKKK